MAKLTRTGGCQCGAVRFEIAADRLVAYACHCLDCQKQTASAFGLSAPVRKQVFAIEGPLGCWGRPAASGATTDCFFCTSCGTRLYHASSHAADWVTIKGGALDDTADLTPRVHLWVTRKQPWVSLPDDAVCFDTQPEDFQAWRIRLAAGMAG
jgi:hypothetical protein